MIEAIGELVRRLFNGNLTTEDYLRLFLVFGMIVASSHLVTMLITRWGDRNIAFKSLVFSVLVHSAGWMGLSTVPPPKTVAKSTLLKEPEQRTEVRELLIESDQNVESNRAGNTPLRESLSPNDTELARVVNPSTNLLPAQSVDRVPLDYDPIDAGFGQPEKQPEMAQAAIPEDQAEERGDRQTASSELMAPNIPFEPRLESRANVPSLSRIPIARTGTDDMEINRLPQAGASERIATEFEPKDTAPVFDAVEDPDAMLASDDAEIVKRKAGPVPTQEDEEIAGSPSDDEGPGAKGAASERRFSRLNMRNRPTKSGRSMESDPERIARTPIPLSRQFDQVRDSPLLDMTSDDLTFTPAAADFEANTKRRRARLPATYSLRSLPERDKTARRFGGTKESETAVELSLKWLASRQNPEGFWDASRYGSGLVKLDENNVDRQNAGLDSDTGVTALTILAFLGAGYTQEEGQYTDNVDRALKWLIAQQKPDGNLCGNATHFAKMYCHAMATYALGEAYGMQKNPSRNIELRVALLRAVTFIASQQNPKTGGWRYRFGQDGDMSMFGWQLMAIKSAQVAGVNVPDIVMERMKRFLRQRAIGPKQGLASYREGDPITPTMTAEALFCRQMVGYLHSDAARQEAVDYVLAHLPERRKLNLYYWYYGTLSMYQNGGKAWTTWNKALRDLLIAEQRKDGVLAGSWDPKGRYGPYGGRIYSTALATLSLEVYYRFLPLYRDGVPVPVDADDSRFDAP